MLYRSIKSASMRVEKPCGYGAKPMNGGGRGGRGRKIEVP